MLKCSTLLFGFCQINFYYYLLLFSEKVETRKVFHRFLSNLFSSILQPGDLKIIFYSFCIVLPRYDVLDEDDCSQVEQLVYCDQRRMAHAAGEFLASRIIRLSIEASPKKLRKGKVIQHECHNNHSDMYPQPTKKISTSE